MNARADDLMVTLQPVLGRPTMNPAQAASPAVAAAATAPTGAAAAVAVTPACSCAASRVTRPSLSRAAAAAAAQAAVAATSRSQALVVGSPVRMARHPAGRRPRVSARSLVGPAPGAT